MSFDPEPILAGLKPFQRNTVEYVFDRFFGSDPIDRFLVADEVGLGKTMIARGLIAKMIELHLREAGRRIDIIYVCSNQAIAQQNFSKLAIVGRESRAVTDRITTLPLHVGGLEAEAPGFDRGINVIPITPTTSLDLRSSVGRADERALLWWMLGVPELGLERTLNRKGARRIFQPPVSTFDSFEWSLDQLDAYDIDSDLWNKFIDRVRSHPEDGPPIVEEIEELSQEFRSERKLWDEPWRTRRIRLVARLRRILATSCINALEPDLVIMDEFQRFPRLMDKGTATGELAEQLFAYPGCKTLLLSATPYKMFSRAQELDEDHYKDFIATTSFLLNDRERSSDLERSMADYRVALRTVRADGHEPIGRARDDVRGQLMRVMCRTERLGADGDRNGMLDASPVPHLKARLDSADLAAYAELEALSQAVETRDVVEFWKSAPYPLNLMDQYQLTERFEEQAKGANPMPISHRLKANEVRAYERIDPGNARLRGLLDELDREGAWKCLWLPPSLPYYAPGRPFADASVATKRLIFSSWKVVPKAIAALTSYEVDRRLADQSNRAPADSQPLRWRREGPMTELLMIAPCPALASITDPLSLAAADAGQDLLKPAQVLDLATRAVRDEIRQLDLPRQIPGRPDFAWYLVALLRLDELHASGTVRRWLTEDALAEKQASFSWARNVRRALAALDSNDELGAVPGDLEQVLAYVGLAGPGAASVRALQRVTPDALHLEVPRHAIRVANALRHMLNLPEAVMTIRGFTSSRSRIQSSDEEVYWRGALDYCLAGNLQAVLDEYAHGLRDWVGGTTPEAKLEAIADTAAEAIGVNAAALPVRDITGDGRVGADPFTLRSRFALRLDRGQGEDEKSVQRVDTVRKAFNSPFWPFVLATTSVGQEGLDFHHYSHAVVHWNLPSNPVDLEQREGRVHRFKNHAVRRNLAAEHRADALRAAPADPWQGMFDAANEEDEGLKPFWVFTGDAKIERHVPAEPMSSDHHRLEELVRLMGLYRLAFGQPRQDELLAALGDLEDAAQELTIRLGPPPWKGATPSPA